MNRASQGFSRRNRALLSERVQRDNFTLIPASQLPFREHWEQLAKSLPAREALVVVLQTETPLTQVARAVVPQLRAKGHHVTVVTEKARCIPSST